VYTSVLKEEDFIPSGRGIFGIFLEEFGPGVGICPGCDFLRSAGLRLLYDDADNGRQNDDDAAKQNWTAAC